MHMSYTDHTICEMKPERNRTSARKMSVSMFVAPESVGPTSTTTNTSKSVILSPRRRLFWGTNLPASSLIRLRGETVHKGDRVTVEPSIECGACAQCRSGRYNLCTNLRFIGTAATVPHIDGGFAEHVVTPASHCYRLPDTLDFGAGALVEPMAVGAQAVRRAGPVAGARVLITGGGTIGQMVLGDGTHAQGATDITLADPAEYPQTFALQHGATATVDPTQTDIAKELFADGGYDLVFEASGAPAALSFAYEDRCPRRPYRADRHATGVGLVTGKSGHVQRADRFRFVSVRPRISDGT